MFELIQNEKIIATKRRHYIALVLQAAPLVFVIILLLSLALFNFFIDFTFLQQKIYDHLDIEMRNVEINLLVSFFTSALASFLWLIVLLKFIFFYFDSWIITNKRIIKIIIVSFFSRKLHTTSLRHIQNIRTSRMGILASIYKFGNLEIETAGNYENFIIRDVSQPEELKKIIFEASEKDRQSPQQSAPVITKNEQSEQNKQ